MAVLFAAALNLHAGEKIELGTAKSKVDPAKDSPLGKQLFKWREKLRDETLTPDLGLVTPRISDPIDPRKERLRKEKLEERRNWMMNDRPTQEEEKEAFLKELEGDSDSFSKTEDRRDKWYKDFKNKQAGGNTTTREPGQLANRNNTPPQTPQYNEEDDDIARSFSKSNSKSGSQAGAHTYNDADFKKVLETPNGSGAAAATPFKLDTDSYGANSAVRMGREQDTKREEFKAFLSGGTPSSPAGPLQAGDLGLGSAPKSTFLTPVQSTPDVSPRNMSDPFAPPGGQGRFGMGYDSSGATMRRDLDQSGVSGLGTLPPSGFGRAGQTFGGFEQPNRARGMNALGGH